MLCLIFIWFCVRSFLLFLLCLVWCSFIWSKRVGDTYNTVGNQFFLCCFILLILLLVMFISFIWFYVMFSSMKFYLIKKGGWDNYLVNQFFHQAFSHSNSTSRLLRLNHTHFTHQSYFIGLIIFVLQISVTLLHPCTIICQNLALQHNWKPLSTIISKYDHTSIFVTIRGAHLHQIRSFFEHCSKSLWPPPPSFWTLCCKFFLMDFLKSA